MERLSWLFEAIISTYSKDFAAGNLAYSLDLFRLGIAYFPPIPMTTDMTAPATKMDIKMAMDKIASQHKESE